MSRPPAILPDVLARLLARLPWWAGVLAAGAAFAILHSLAAVAPAFSAATANTTGAALSGLLAGLATIGQYLVPLAFLLGAALGAYLRLASKPSRYPARYARERREPSLAFGPEGEGTEEEAVGEALTALVRTTAAPGEPASAPRRPIGVPFRLAPHRIVDLVGMTAAIGLIWLTYAWFDALPPAPAHGAWGLSEAEAASAAQRTKHSAPGGPPLGRLVFAPPFDPSAPVPAPAAVEASPTVEPEPVYDTLRELEAAFEARYVPPPECYDLSSPGRLAGCGNHRIRARRAFVESEGRTMEPTPVVPDPPPEPAWPVEEGDWRVVEPATPWQEEQDWAYAPRWREEPEPATDAAAPWTKRQEDETPDWRTPREWTEPQEWRPRLAPLDETPPEARRPAPVEPPQVRRLPVEEWGPQSDLSTQLEWPRGEASEDARWQEEWLRLPAPEGSRDWGSR